MKINRNDLLKFYSWQDYCKLANFKRVEPITEASFSSKLEQLIDRPTNELINELLILDMEFCIAWGIRMIKANPYYTEYEIREHIHHYAHHIPPTDTTLADVLVPLKIRAMQINPNQLWVSLARDTFTDSKFNEAHFDKLWADTIEFEEGGFGYYEDDVTLIWETE